MYLESYPQACYKLHIPVSYKALWSYYIPFYYLIHHLKIVVGCSLMWFAAGQWINLQQKPK